MHFNSSTIPDNLKNKPNWILWAKKPRDGGGTDKIPINARTLGKAQSNNSSTWTDFDTACRSLKANADGQAGGGVISGLGFMLYGSGIVCIDLDHIGNDLQAYRDGRQQGIVWEFMHHTEGKAYAEISQSGEGVHIFAAGHLPEGSRRRNGVEMYDDTKGRFIAMTGDLIDNTHTTILDSCTDLLKELHGKYLAPKKQQPSRAVNAAPLPVYDVDIQKALDTANKVDKKFSALWAGDITGYPSQSESDQALCNKLAYYLHGDRTKMDTAFRASGLYRDKWDRKTGDTTYGAMTIDTAIKDITEFFDYNKQPYKITITRREGDQTEGAGNTPEPVPPTEGTPLVIEPEQTYQKLEKLGFSTKWRKQGGMLYYDGVKKCNRNIKLYIWFRNLLNDVRYNEFAGYAERLKGGKWEKISDYDLLQLITRIEKKAYTEGGDYADLKVISEWDIKKEFVADYILENAKRVNPVKEYFESLHWDGKERISTLLHDVLGADNNAYTATATRLFLLGIISRIYAPGTKFDYMIILQGRQGYGKSAFLKALAVNPEWYGSIGAAHMGGTDAKKLLGEDAAGKIILEYEELDGIRQTTAEKLKATITRTDDQYRQAYSVLSEMHPRQYVFAGTTNNGQYLSDPTGNRRFLPIPITKKGFLTPETVNQVWAEAFTLYKQGNFKLYLDDDVETIAETYRDNATRLISDDFTETIEGFLNCRTPDGTPIQTTTVKAIYQALCDDPLGKMKYNDAQKIIITALNTLQWTNKQVKINGKNCRRYVRPQGDT